MEFGAYVYASEGATSSTDCEKELKQKLLELIENDHKGILSKQFELTTLKLAIETSKSNSITLEHYIKKQADEIKKMDSEKVLESVSELYKENGFAQDMKKAFLHLQENVDKASYWNKNTRLYNQDISAFLMYNKLKSNSTLVNDIDVASVWFMKKLTESNLGSGQTNVNNMSYHVTKLLGGISGFEKTDLSKLKLMQSSLEVEIQNLIAEASNSLKQELQACVESGEIDSCVFENNKISDSLAKIILEANKVTDSAMHKFTPPPVTKQKSPIANVFDDPDENNKPVGAQCEREGFTWDRRKSFSWPPALKGVSEILDEIVEKSLKASEEIKKNQKSRKTPGKVAPSIDLFLYDAKMCCHGKSVNSKVVDALIGVKVSPKMQFFYGIPYIAEVGVEFGADIALQGGGRMISTQYPACSKNCLMIQGRVEPYSAIYAELVEGLASIKGGVRFTPSVSARLCQKTGFVAEAKLGQLALFYSATAAWNFTVTDSFSLNEMLKIPKNGQARCNQEGCQWLAD